MKAENEYKENPWHDKSSEIHKCVRWVNFDHTGKDLVITKREKDGTEVSKVLQNYNPRDFNGIV